MGEAEKKVKVGEGAGDVSDGVGIVTGAAFVLVNQKRGPNSKSLMCRKR